MILGDSCWWRPKNLLIGKPGGGVLNAVVGDTISGLKAMSEFKVQKDDQFAVIPCPMRMYDYRHGHCIDSRRQIAARRVWPVHVGKVVDSWLGTRDQLLRPIIWGRPQAGEEVYRA
ncbi:hypothetical protein E4U22_004182 [Claviceps purpurea]|nr:hypothetical protein E4U22_004182 [Claviceps purpurea]